MKYLLMLIVLCLVTGCASTTLKAPCDQKARYCGTKTAINTTAGYFQ